MWSDDRLNYGQRGDTGPPGSFFQLGAGEDIRQVWQPPVFLSNARAAVRPAVLQDNSQLLLMSDGQLILQTRYSSVVPTIYLEDILYFCPAAFKPQPTAQWD